MATLKPAAPNPGASRRLHALGGRLSLTLFGAQTQVLKKMSKTKGP
jgi:hypothetical protein